jgi:hypothetical protein
LLVDRFSADALADDLTGLYFAGAISSTSVIAAGAMNLGWPAGDDRQVVRVGEGRHDAVGDQIGAGLQHLLEPWRAARGDRGLDIAGHGAVDADHDGRLESPSVDLKIDPVPRVVRNAVVDGSALLVDV